MRAPLAVFVVGLTLATAAPAAWAECRVSESGAFSVDVTLSPASGILCLTDVRVFEGGGCGPGPERWAATLGCSETQRMVVTDAGRLVSLLAPRASRREWEMLRVFEPDGDHVAVRSVRLDELPGLPAGASRPRLTLDAREVRLATEPPVAIPVSAVELLGRQTGRRRAWRR